MRDSSSKEAEMSGNQGTLAVLCADVTGGNLLQAHLGASEADYAIRRCEKRITQLVEGYDGRLVKHGSNKLMAYFSGSDEALQSAVDMQKRVAALPPLSGISLGVRVGVCVGHDTRETRFFEDAHSNPAVSLSEFAHPGQLLLSVPARAKGIHWSEFVARKMPEVSLNCGNRKLGVFEIDWRKCDSAALRPVEAPAGEKELRLALRLNDSTLVLNRHRPSVTIGRQPGCDLMLREDSCSRLHAVLEFRGDRFVLIDKSTNGSFVTLEGRPEQRLHRKELVLTGQGQLSFGGPAADAGHDRMHFRLEQD